MSAVRFFTSAALRPQEEVPGEVVQWLPRAITVEYAGDRPVTGVWRSITGDQRVCWFGREPSAELLGEHAERYGREPFWIIDRPDARGTRVEAIECDADGRILAKRIWEFDRDGMPLREEEHDADGALRVIRTYKCTSDGTVYASTEQRGRGAAVDRPRPIPFPTAELAGEPVPCGGTITRDGPRLVESIAFNSYQARFFAVYRDGAQWKRGLATMATSKAGWPEEMRSLLELEDAKLAPLIKFGALVDRRHQGYSFFGVVEALPEGETLEQLVRQQPLTLENVLALALEIADVAWRAHAQGYELGGIRPELVYVKTEEGGFSLSGIAHRGPAVISTTYSGEQIRWPPVFACDFSSPDDARGLAQLVWFALTGGHPFLAADDMWWNPSWNEFRHKRTRRQAWTGPAEVGGILERVLFGESGRPDFEGLVRELERLRSAGVGDM